MKYKTIAALKTVEMTANLALHRSVCDGIFSHVAARTYPANNHTQRKMEISAAHSV